MAIFDVPPPISRFITFLLSFLDISQAPEPYPASNDSSLGPAVATTKLPKYSERSLDISLAFSFLAVSPVIITAPVDILLFSTLHKLSASETISLIFIKSMVTSSKKGVNKIGLLYIISLSSMIVSSTNEVLKIFFIFNLLTITSVVDVPISTPMLYISFLKM